MNNNFENMNVAILDSNLLLLFILGLNNNESKINHPRTSKYNIKHFNELKNLFNNYDYLITLPQILLETFHLLKHPQKNNKTPQKNYLYRYIEFINKGAIIEENVESINIIKNNLIFTLGYTDTAIFLLANFLLKKHKYNNLVVVSDDENLVNLLKKYNIHTLSFDIKNAKLY
ncbi:hypothetical protein LJB96_05035 [Methanobrevibacter sp. OttesenSCG-928-K11]|nr:hypothetical protein [Methanobrevibacter sp. OttesenSCG-928-K11]MDL2270460.1 hypothetical protein [Methanobrevibacter sp. OttesenSCG-928-I08]